MQTPADRIAKRLSAAELRERAGDKIVPLGTLTSRYAPTSSRPPADRVAVRA